MCFFDHSFVHIFFVFHLFAKPILEFRENIMFFRTVLKSSNYNYLSRRKVLFFAAREVMTEFSAAWCLSVVSQGAKATYIRTQSAQYNFASLRIVEGSAGAVVAESQIKAVELDFFLHIELLQFLLFARSSRRSFLRTVQSIQQYGFTE